MFGWSLLYNSFCPQPPVLLLGYLLLPLPLSHFQVRLAQSHSEKPKLLWQCPSGQCPSGQLACLKSRSFLCGKAHIRSIKRWTQSQVPNSGPGKTVRTEPSCEPIPPNHWGCASSLTPINVWVRSVSWCSFHVIQCAVTVCHFALGPHSLQSSKHQSFKVKCSTLAVKSTNSHLGRTSSIWKNRQLSCATQASSIYSISLVPSSVTRDDHFHYKARTVQTEFWMKT